jgi:hypothetical protein
MWRCTLPAGSYTVAIRSITAVSSHEYILDAVARVVEVNIDTTGTLLARFYVIEPLTPSGPVAAPQMTLEKLQQAVTEATTQVTGQEPIWRKVVKNYPTTTHSRTVEYRLDSREQLHKLYESADEAFRKNRNGSFKPDK